MKKITHRFIETLLIIAFIMSIMVDIPIAKANDLYYTFENGIPNRTVLCNGHTSEFTVYVDGFYYNLKIDSNPIISAYCDEFGTFWFQSSNYGDGGFEFYWTNYELEGFNMIPHYFNNGSFHISVGNLVDGYSNNITDEKFQLPTFNDLKNYIENGVPVPGSKPEPIIDPEPSSEPKPSVEPKHSPEPKSSPTPQPSPTLKPLPSSEPSPQVTPLAKPATIKKVVTSKNIIKLINSNNEAVDKAIFNKKKLALSYKGKKITKVKGVWFTKKGYLIFLKTNSEAYYLNGKKSKLIKSKVLSVKTHKKFATALKLKNGKIYKLK